MPRLRSARIRHISDRRRRLADLLWSGWPDWKRVHRRNATPGSEPRVARFRVPQEGWVFSETLLLPRAPSALATRILHLLVDLPHVFPQISYPSARFKVGKVKPPS